MENTIENKQKFFVQYWEQIVFRWLYADGRLAKSAVRVGSTNFDYAYIDEGYLELTPLSAITDEDAIEVARICLDPKEKTLEVLEIQKWDWCLNIITKEETDLINLSVTIKMYIRISFEDCDIQFTWDYNHEKGTAIDERHCHNSFQAYQYLQLKGYALPYMGLRVEQLIEYGWIKLKQD